MSLREVLHEQFRRRRALRLGKRGLVNVYAADAPAVHGLGNAVDMVEVVVTYDDRVQPPDPHIVEERYDDARSYVIAVQRAGIEQDVGSARQPGQERLTVAHVETGDAQVIAVRSLPLQDAQGYYQHQRQGRTNALLQGGATQRCEAGEQDQNIVQDNQHQRHMADQNIGEVDLCHGFDHPDKQAREEVKKVAQEDAQGGQEEGQEDFQEAQGQDRSHRQCGQYGPEARERRDAVKMVEKNAGAAEPRRKAHGEQFDRHPAQTFHQTH